jgi:hypothetical protein
MDEKEHVSTLGGYGMAIGHCLDFLELVVSFQYSLLRLSFMYHIV